MSQPKLNLWLFADGLYIPQWLGISLRLVISLYRWNSKID
jgi:hypothetical protein